MRRTSAMMVAASSCVPCEKLSRTTLTPAKKSDRSIAGSRDAGPTVATIFVRFGGGCIGARRSPALLAVLRLDESSDGITSSRKRFAQGWSEAPAQERTARMHDAGRPIQEAHIERPSPRRDTLALGISFVIHALTVLLVVLFWNGTVGGAATAVRY